MSPSINKRPRKRRNGEQPTIPKNTTSDDVAPALPSYEEKLLPHYVPQDIEIPSTTIPTVDTSQCVKSFAETNTTGFAALFSPPPILTNNLSFQDTLSLAKTQQRWVLVNIQKEDVFSSHRLNRDVWRSESVQAIVSSAFIFWQRGIEDYEGTEFSQLYQVAQLPHICVIQPSTGRLVKKWETKKFQDEYAAASELLEFIESISLQDNSKLHPSASLPGTACFGSSSSDSKKNSNGRLEHPMNPMSSDILLSNEIDINVDIKRTRTKSVSTPENDVVFQENLFSPTSMYDSDSPSDDELTINEQQSILTDKINVFKEYQNVNNLLKSLHEERIKRIDSKN